MLPRSRGLLHRAQWRACGHPALSRPLSSRLTPHAPPDLAPDRQAVYSSILADRQKASLAGGFPLTNEDGSLVGPWNAMVASPAIGALMERMGSACRNQNSCASDLYEVGILVVGEEWQSQFEWYAHERLALKAGIAPTVISAIKRRAPPAELARLPEATPEQAAVYTYARELHETRRVGSQTHERALAAVGGERQLVDLTFTMGFYHQISMALNAFDVPLPPGEEPPFPEPPKV